MFGVTLTIERALPEDLGVFHFSQQVPYVGCHGQLRDLDYEGVGHDHQEPASTNQKQGDIEWEFRFYDL